MERSLRDLVARLPIPGLKESTDRHIVAEALMKILSYPIKPQQIIVKDSILTVSVPPTLKSALRVKQEHIKTVLLEKGIIVREVR